MVMFCLVQDEGRQMLGLLRFCLLIAHLHNEVLMRTITQK